MDNRTLDYEKIAAFISERRKAKQLTQKQLAELWGVTDSPCCCLGARLWTFLQASFLQEKKSSWRNRNT